MSGPALEALARCATAPTPELLDQAASEVLLAWWRLRGRDDPERTAEYMAIFDALAALHPLAACRLGLELRRRIVVEVPAWSALAAEAEGDAPLASEVEERLLRALWLRLQDAMERAGGGP